MKKKLLYGIVGAILAGNNVAYAQFLLKNTDVENLCASVYSSNKLAVLSGCNEVADYQYQQWQTVSFPQLSNVDYPDMCLEGAENENMFLKACQGGPKQDWLFDKETNMIRNAADSSLCAGEVAGLLQVQKCDDNQLGQHWKIVSDGTTDLRDNLIAAYLFYGNAEDVSGNGHKGTVTEASLAKDRLGTENSAYLFNGESSYIEVQDAEALRLSDTDFTLSAWVYETQRNDGNADAILSKIGSRSEDGWMFLILGKNQKPQGSVLTRFSSGRDPDITTENPVVGLNNWHHVVLTYENGLQEPAAIYVDADVKDSSQNFTQSPNPNTTSNMFIGKDSADLFNGYYFHGKLDDIQIYNKVLSTSEIKALSDIR